jgi:multisubunit Na+/H+ antiporter MnhB subunit
MTSEDSIAARTGAGGSSPGSVLVLITITLASVPSRVAAAIIVLAIAGFVVRSVMMRTCSPGFAFAQVSSIFIAPLNALVVNYTDPESCRT